MAIGRVQEAHRTFRQLEALREDSDPGLLAMVYAHLGRSEEARALLSRARLPFVESLEGHPRFQDLLRRIGFPET
jgi:Flp pilus assembly protein TadD